MTTLLRVGRSSFQLIEKLQTEFGVARWTARAVDTEQSVVVDFFAFTPEPLALEVALPIELALLSKLHPPGFVCVLSAGVVDGQYVEVRSALEGETLLSRITREPLSPEEFIETAWQTLDLLDRMHSVGVCHGGITTGTLTLTPDGIALNDLGLAQRLGCPDRQALRHASPEMLGLLNFKTGAFSDLYSLGLVLRDCLLGPNSQALSFAQRLDALNDLPTDLPSELDGLLRRLCAPEPRHRYQTAKGARVDLERFQQGERRFPLGQQDLRASLTLPAFIGRRKELYDLQTAVSGAASLTVLTAPSGRGKSAVLKALAEQLRSEGKSVCFGQSVAPRATMAPTLWPTLLSAIAEVMSAQAKERLTGELTEVEKGRLQAFTSWRFLGSGRPEDQVSEATLAEALTTALNLLASVDELVLVLDDVQWADGLTLRLLERHDRRFPCLIAYRIEEETSRLRALRESSRWVALEPLNEDEAREFLTTMAGPLAESVWRPLITRAQGEPFWLQSLLRGAVEADDLVPRVGGWVWKDEVELRPDAQMGRDLTERLASLSRDTLELLGAGAAVGKVFSLELACRMSEVDADFLDEAVDRGLVWRSQDRVSFSHDKIKEATNGTVDPETAKQWHRRAAHYLESVTDSSSSDLASHWSQAGEVERAFPYARKAAEDSMASLNYATARAMWQVAAKSDELDHSVELCRLVKSGLARSHYLAGDSAAAVPLYLEALEVVKAPLLRANLIAEMVSAMSKICQFDQMMEWARRGLSELSVKVPAGLSLKLAAGKEVAYLLATLRGARAQRVSEHERAVGRLLVWLCEGALRKERPDLAAWSICLAARRMYCQDAPAEAALAFGFCSFVFGAVGLVKHRAQLNEIAQEFVHRYPECAGHICGMSGMTPLQDGLLEEALLRFHSGWELSRAYADGWNRQVCQLHRCWALLFLGRLEEARDGFFDLLDGGEGTDITIEWVAALGLSISGKDVPLQNAWKQEMETRYRGSMFEGLLVQLEGQHALVQGRWQEGVGFLEKTLKKVHLRTTLFGATAGGWLATALRLQAEGLALEQLGARNLIQQRITTVLKVAFTSTKAWKIVRPHLLREQAILECFQGRYDLARSFFEESYRLAERLGLSFELAWTRYERGRFSAVAGWADWSSEMGEGLADAARLRGWIPGVDLTWSRFEIKVARVERFDRLLEAGRGLVSLGATSSALTTLVSEAKELLRCEVALVGEDSAKLSPEVWVESLVQECSRKGRAVSASGEGWSVMMAPVRKGELQLATLVAWHRLVGDFFGEEELRLADYLCTLAGASLENAEVVEHTEQAMKELEVSEARFRGVFTNVGLGVALLDSGGAVLAENRALQRMLGETYVGRPLWEVFSTLDRSRLEEELRACIGEPGYSFVGEAYLAGFGTGQTPVQVRLGTLAFDRASPNYFLSIAETTDRRTSELMNYLGNERGSLAGQLESALGYGLSELEGFLCETDLSETLGEVRQLLVELRSGTDALSSSLRRPLDFETSLAEKVSTLLQRFSERGRPTLELDWSGELPEVSDLASLVLLRVLQEGLTNVGKHSRASRVKVQLQREKDQLQLRLVDDGCGFDVTQWSARRAVRNSFGILSMRERAQAVGAQFELLSSPGRGTELRLDLPLVTDWIVS